MENTEVLYENNYDMYENNYEQPQIFAVSFEDDDDSPYGKGRQEKSACGPCYTMARFY